MGLGLPPLAPKYFSFSSGRKGVLGTPTLTYVKLPPSSVFTRVAQAAQVQVEAIGADSVTKRSSSHTPPPRIAI